MSICNVKLLSMQSHYSLIAMLSIDNHLSYWTILSIKSSINDTDNTRVVMQSVCIIFPSL